MDRITKSYIQKLLSILAFSLIIFSIGCEKEKIADNIDNDDQKSEVEIINEKIYESMQDIYLWNDSLPDIAPSDYDTPEEFLSALRYQPIDKWSYIMSTTEFNQYFDQGEYLGHGILIALDNEENIRIGFVYKNTQAYQEGIRRSWIIKKIDGTDVTPENVNSLLGSSEEAITNTILFLDGDENEKEIQLTKETVKINAVLHSETIEQDSKKIGYVVFQEFISTANNELKTVFEEFSSQSIDELIIDLRYNGGGLNSVAEYFASWIAGNKSSSVFYKLLHNEENESRNVTVNFSGNVDALNLNRIFFITTNGSASASELLINGLKPYYDVKLVGSNTSGKPVGMYAISFRNYDYTLVPISFKYVNAQDVGDFYDGLTVDYPAEDDKTHMFGDPEESSLKEALSQISRGLSVKSATIPTETKILSPSRSGVNQFLRAY